MSSRQHCTNPLHKTLFGEYDGATHSAMVKIMRQGNPSYTDTHIGLISAVPDEAHTVDLIAGGIET